jgi:uncharacterized protein DUF6978
MLTQIQADRLIELGKEAERSEPLNWASDRQENEVLIATEEKSLRFVLSLKRNPFEIRLHLRTRDRDIGLVRVDNSRYHPNPDGTEIIDQPHLHRYREGYGLEWAEAVDWYDVSDPYGTLGRFLRIINAQFPCGIQIVMF